MTAPPCKDCPNRAPGCHDRCEKFRAWRAAHAQELERRARYIEADATTVRGIHRRGGYYPAKRKK